LDELREAKKYAENGEPTPREVFDDITDAEWVEHELKSRTPDAIVNP
jgi:hypothetical protein